MGLYIHSLEHIPTSASRDYFVYLLDYDWHEPLGQALRDNYEHMSAIAAKNNAVVIRGTEEHFSNEVLSWHQVNGENSRDLLPAILIANKHPIHFRDKKNSQAIKSDPNLKMILIPLKKSCKTTTDVVSLIHTIFEDIKSEKDLDGFSIARELKPGMGRALVDSLILEPNISGIGISFKKLFGWLKS